MFNRTKDQFNKSLLKGLQVEEDFAQKVALMGGHATPFGPPPAQHFKGEFDKPSTSFIRSNGEFGYFPSPDLLITFPHFSGQVQIKAKKLQRSGKADQHFLLDQKEKTLMERSNSMSLPTLFVVCCDELDFMPNLSRFSFVDVADLHHDISKLHRRKIYDKSVFEIPLRLFRSFSTQNINRLGKTYYDFEGRRDAYRTGADPADVGQLRAGPNESSSSAGNPHHYAMA